MAAFLTNGFHPFLTAVLGAVVAGQGTLGWIAWGNGATPASALLTAVSGEQGPSRAGVTLSETQTQSANDTLVITGATLTAASAFTLTQVGVCDAASGGNLLVVADVTPSVAMATNDTLRVIVQIQVI